MLKYVGDGYLPGVPARDLSDEEVKRHGEKRLLSSGLYKNLRVYKRPEVAEEVIYGTRDQEPTPDTVE